MPPAQCNRMAGLTLLALCKLRPDSEWKDATRTACTVTKSIMDYLREHYDVAYAPNTRETFRRQVLHQFVQAAIAAYNPFEPNLPTNSPRAHYAITEAALAVVKTYGDSAWQRAVASFARNRVRFWRRIGANEASTRSQCSCPRARFFSRLANTTSSNGP